jgi:hypothetical protein
MNAITSANGAELVRPSLSRPHDTETNAHQRDIRNSSIEARGAFA